MKIGKTIVQMYAGLQMILLTLALLVLVGIGSIGGMLGAGTDIASISTIIGAVMGLLVVFGIVELYIYWNLFKFKDWARKVWAVIAVIGLLMSFNIVSLLLNGLLGYLMFIDKDTEKAFK
jgi:hypothetical protein